MRVVEFAALHATCELVCSALGFGAGRRHRDFCKSESEPQKASRGRHNNFLILRLYEQEHAVEIMEADI